mmetsp:Transcript_2599/g.7772  ORF Transcript_2599/g.7772 Transcript_2599/m.7772 type:complete len:229 (+) Transcript_2599:202-888(+)
MTSQSLEDQLRHSQAYDQHNKRGQDTLLRVNLLAGRISWTFLLISLGGSSCGFGCGSCGIFRVGAAPSDVLHESHQRSEPRFIVFRASLLPRKDVLASLGLDHSRLLFLLFRARRQSLELGLILKSCLLKLLHTTFCLLVPGSHLGRLRPPTFDITRCLLHAQSGRRRQLGGIRELCLQLCLAVVAFPYLSFQRCDLLEAVGLLQLCELGAPSRERLHLLNLLFRASL